MKMKKSAAAALLILLSVAGTASAETITLAPSDFVVFGGEYTRIGGHTVITGNIGSNGDLLVFDPNLVPESASLILMGTALLALSWRWRSKSGSLRH